MKHYIFPKLDKIEKKTLRVKKMKFQTTDSWIDEKIEVDVSERSAAFADIERLAAAIHFEGHQQAWVQPQSRQELCSLNLKFDRQTSRENSSEGKYTVHAECSWEKTREESRREENLRRHFQNHQQISRCETIYHYLLVRRKLWI